MQTLVVGCGYLGARVLTAMPDAIGLSRSATTSSIRQFAFDADRDTELPLTLPDEFQILYTVPPNASDDEKDSRLERFLGLLSKTPRRLVYISTTGVYGNSNGELIDETAPLAPTSDRARRRVVAERTVESELGLNNAIILRVPGIYGPDRLGEERLRQNIPVIAEAEASPGNRIHVDDLTDCCIAAFDAPPGVYNVGDGDHRSGTAFQKMVAAQLGLAPPPEISLAQANKTFSRRRLSFLSDSRRIDTTKMRATLGVVPTYANPADGIRNSINATSV